MSGWRSEIIGVGAYVPPQVYSNFDIEKMMDTTHDWIVQRTGIESRHWADEDVSNSDLAVAAVNECIESARSENITLKDIDLIIYATLSPDHEFPGTGCFLQAKLNIPEIPVLDIRQQCTGFLYALSIADSFIKSGVYKNILIVGSELHSKGLDRTPRGRNVAVLFGDGAGAILLTAKKFHDHHDSQIFHTRLHADGSFAKELWIPGPGTALGAERMTHSMIDEGLQYPDMNGKLVFVHATKRMAETLTATLNSANLSIGDVDLFLFHQANLRINSKVAEMMGIPEEKIFNTIQKYGNTTAATIPLGMRDAIRQGKLKKGMIVASAAFGSGFTWASSVWRQ